MPTLGDQQQKQDKPISPSKKLRLRVGLAQAGLTKRIPDKAGSGTLSRRPISAWERGEYQPELTIPQMKALCKILGDFQKSHPRSCHICKGEAIGRLSLRQL